MAESPSDSLDRIITRLCQAYPAIEWWGIRSRLNAFGGFAWDPQHDVRRLPLVASECSNLEERLHLYEQARDLLMKFLKLLPSPLPSTSAEQTEEELLDRLMRITRSRHRALKAELETARLLPRQDARGKTRGRKGTIRAGDWDTKKWEWLGDCAQSLYDYLAPHIRPERKSRGLYTERVLTVIAELLNAAYSLDPGLDAHAIKTRLQSRRKKP